jgi:REP-associated tyrosine transposase
MVLYRRNLVPGGSYFFTVTLAERGSDRLVRHVGLLREAFRVARRERPFRIDDAIVVLPDHLHAVLDGAI